VIGAAWRLVSFGNAFLLGRYDEDGFANAALSRGIARWRFDTLQPRPYGLAPLRTVARNPYGWFRWLRKNGCRRLTLRWLSLAEYSLLDGPLKVFTTHEFGYMVVSEHANALPMLWNVWRVDYTSGVLSTRAAKVQYRGSDVFALPDHAAADADALVAPFAAVLTEASALAPDDAPQFERARAALHARDPESAVPADELPMLAPSTHPLGARRLLAAALIAQRANAPRGWGDELPPRPADFAATIHDAVVAAANTIAR
jgi:hypothetical protein